MFIEVTTVTNLSTDDFLLVSLLKSCDSFHLITEDPLIVSVSKVQETRVIFP